MDHVYDDPHQQEIFRGWVMFIVRLMAERPGVIRSPRPISRAHGARRLAEPILGSPLGVNP